MCASHATRASDVTLFEPNAAVRLSHNGDQGGKQSFAANTNRFVIGQEAGIRGSRSEDRKFKLTPR